MSDGNWLRDYGDVTKPEDRAMKVVVGIEDKVFGEAIIEFIGTQKWAPGTEFRLVHVIDNQPTGEIVGELCCPDAVKLVDAEKQAAQELLMNLDLELLKHVTDAQSEQKILSGRPKDILLDEIEQWPADLLIVGSHGRHGFSRFLLGSVSMALLSQAPCSVLIVKMPVHHEEKPAAELASSATK
jgi:nucleotide-binding universal stress UspA family protein